MSIHKSIKAGKLFFKSHYMVPSTHFSSYFEQSEMKEDFLKEEIEQLRGMPFIEVTDYKCSSRRARTSGSFFPSFDLPIIEAAGFMISHKQHLPFYRPITHNSWNPLKQIGYDYRLIKSSMEQDNHFPYLRNTLKVPHAVGIKVKNHNLFFKTLHKARARHAREVMYHLMRKTNRSDIESFLEQFAPLAKISVFYELFSQVNAFMQHEDSENYMRNFIFSTYLGTSNTSSIHTISKMNGKLEQLAALEEITEADYRAFLQDGVLGRIAESLMDDMIHFYQININVDATQVLSSYQGKRMWNRDVVGLFYMVYLRHHHALFLKENSLFDSFVSLYSQAVGQRLKDESETNAPLLSALSGKLSNEEMWQHHHHQNSMPTDYVHPLFNPGVINKKVEQYNQAYARTTDPLLILFAKTYFTAGSERTLMEDAVDENSSHTLGSYPGYNYDYYYHRLNSAMRKSIFFNERLHEAVDGMLRHLAPPKTFDAHVPFEIFLHHPPGQNLVRPPSKLDANFELS